MMLISCESILVIGVLKMTTNQEATEQPVVAMPTESSSYDQFICKSFDHKPIVIQMQSINFAMMHFFGGMVSSGGDHTGDILNYEWLKDRGEVEPLKDWGHYMRYRSQYKFD